MRCETFLFLSAIACAPAAFAKDASPASSEIVVTAPMEGSRIESLQGATLLSRDAVIENLSSGLGETLAKSPGISSTFYGAGASRPVIRGLGDDRIRVLENGIGAIDASSASPDHAITADGLDAKRIEVLRGAAALAYGGNAVGGVINVLDDSIPTRRPENGLGGEGLIALTDGNDGREASLGVTADAQPFVIRLDAAGRETGNYDIPGFTRSAALRAAEPLPGSVAEPSGEAPNSWASLRSYAAGASLVQDWGYSGVAFKRYQTSYGLPPEEAGSLVGGQIQLKQSRVETRGDVKVDFGPFTRVDWGAQYSDYTHSEIEGTGEVATTFTNTGFEARFEAHNEAFDKKLKGAVGIQYTDTNFAAEGEEAFIRPTSTRDYGVFTVQRWDQGRYGFDGGLRVEGRNLDNLIAGKSDFTTISASAGAFVRPAPDWFAGITLGHTERAPSGIELYANGPHFATAAYEQGNANLNKETAISAEGSVRFENAERSLEVNVYRIDFTDYIALIPTGQTFVESFGAIVDASAIPIGANVLPVFAFTARDATFTGGEISLSSKLFEVGAFSIDGDLAFDLVRASFKSGGAVPRIPPRTARLGVSAESDHLKARIEVAAVAEQNRTAEFEAPTDGYTELSARLTWRPQGAASPYSVLLDGRNLTDQEERVHSSYLKDELPRPGRSVRLVLLAKF